MGFVFSKVFGRLFSKKDIRILILGLDNAGKTTILNKLHLNDVVQTIPTIGFNVETVTFKNLKFQVWDLGGQSGIRPYWRSYYPNTNGIIYVVDSVDKDRLDTTKQELLSMLQEEELKAVPLMVLANKQDLAGAQSEEKISEFMGLTNIKDRQWSIFKCSALTGHGLNEGMDWLVNVLESQK
ncbi:ADP-ribosylation factor(Arf)/Arf-like (ARL) small GTPase family protein (macronuclear) [Tetrahymena thermophila SB210]|uniref:ADP-ribosylation factor(Arf)/Arf-like (ARL) small GTPase family protein n=1 Tax=Tetrahymena thermophila (strain SB210) TaxID=312017 RepID=Q22UW8_TETTS|nr:ADP-ribosylation factor(Arf)/Arf-like (ARL) small GTPase family protein [Tetrahymena thermophila SB210]EAR89180.2 ADP-ribosylation factor(Arf)/Arf-like (ARL) small GTPase family protein [Tetrahymena thermophila SB210]|eukprot:XP_001009425.2 ADP-ribosylation factor(Arf)/Arf-like (ARL) small GTPase family protein [Tetrahymena thermophila SB210]